MKDRQQLPVTATERIADLLGIVALVAMVTVIIWKWSSLPAEVPAHFGYDGEVDRWGSKWELLILPVISSAMHVFIQFIEKRPHMHNYPARLNDTNRQAFYLHSRRTVNWTKNTCTLLFAYITWRTILIANGEAVGLGMIPFSVLLVLLLAAVAWGAIGMKRIR